MKFELRYGEVKLTHGSGPAIADSILDNISELDIDEEITIAIKRIL